ncbi:MAG: methyl-accepting chemotaxis protein [Treponemataceae bacterium]|nr:methyl-accepting chemotaxis protein [Treponemataceae bacterium]
MFKFLQPSQEVIEGLDFKQRNKISFLIFGNLAMFFLMTVFTLIEATLHNYPVAAVACVSAIMGFVALYSIRRGKILVGAVTATVALNLANILVCVFTTFKYADPNIIYRNAFFASTMAVLNLMMSISKKQMEIHDFFSTLILFASFVISTGLMRATDPTTFYTTVVISGIAYVVVCICLTYLTGFNDDLIQKFRTESEISEQNIQKIKNVIGESEEGLKVGDELKKTANNSSGNASMISDSFDSLMPKIHRLSERVSAIDDNIKVIEQNSEKMKASASRQARAVETTSSAMVEISANVTTIADTAKKRKTELSGVIENVSRQMDLAKELSEELTKVEEYSSVISGFVQTINNVAEQTNLLAMNASIEAAHAGNAGKGFSVIAQEIRKLANQTTQNANNIGDVLHENSEVVASTVTTMENFTKYITVGVASTTETLNAIDEIISGIMEIDIGTRDVMTGVNDMVEVSRENSTIADTVTAEIEKQVQPVDEVNEFMRSLDTELQLLSVQVNEIKNLMGKIYSFAELNSKVGATIMHSLSEI